MGSKVNRTVSSLSFLENVTTRFSRVRLQMNWQLFFSVYTLIFLAELSDKTAFATLLLADLEHEKHRPYSCRHHLLYKPTKNLDVSADGEYLENEHACELRCHVCANGCAVQRTQFPNHANVGDARHGYVHGCVLRPGEYARGHDFH